MNCPRCNSLAQNNLMSGGEYSFICSACGYFSARVIDTFVDNYPIYKYIEQKPLGVIVTKDTNIQYYTPYQRSSIVIENKNCLGYTVFKDGEWVFYDFKKNTHIPLSSVAEVYF